MLGVFHLDVKLLGVGVTALVACRSICSPVVAVQNAARLAAIVGGGIVERYDVAICL